MSAEMTKLLAAFARAHHCAVQADRNEHISDVRLLAWSKSHEAERELVRAIEKLEAAVAHNPRKETIE